MARTPTRWRNNPDKTDGVSYSDSTVSYSSSTTSFSTSTATLDEFDKDPTRWSPVSKIANNWSNNAAALTNQYLYDSGSYTYDSAVQTYDGIVVGQDMQDIKTPSVWSNA